MNKTERQKLRSLVADFTAWDRQSAHIRAWHDSVQRAADAGVDDLRRRSVTLKRAKRAAWRVVPLGDKDLAIVRRLADRANLPVLQRDDHAVLNVVARDLRRALDDARAVLGVRRFFSGSAKRDRAQVAADYLQRHHDAFTSAGGPARLDCLGHPTGRVDATQLGFEELLTLLPRESRETPALLDRTVLAGLPAALDTIATVAANEASYRTAAQDAGEVIRQAEVRRLLREMSVDALKAATQDRLRTNLLTQARITTVQAVLDRGQSLRNLSGMGEKSLQRILGAAETIRKTTHDETPVRIDISNRTPETTHLLQCLAAWDATRQKELTETNRELADELQPLRRLRAEQLLVIPTGFVSAASLEEAIQIVRRSADLLDTAPRARGTSTSTDPWEDFLARPADYFSMLAELGFGGNEDGAHGNLPEEIKEAVRNQPLNDSLVTVSLRGYQKFAARFALVQRKVLIGDEMGLGKTLEAIAVLAHLHTSGESHFLVVCPAAVVTNWTREITRRSKLRPHRVHGPERANARKAWLRQGGVAVTTYETLKWWSTAVPTGPDPACLVVDEAHYIKNPQAQRSERVQELIGRTEYAILLTGTPLENRVGEFRSLISYLRPDLLVDDGGQSFRRQVAPAYLRRNQEDVLTELPGVIDAPEWLPMSPADRAKYRTAVMDRNFTAMRQAAMLAGTESAKMQRLIDIVREAAANGRRVLVFSYFLNVLSQVADALPGKVFGPLTGRVRADRRQDMVDDFRRAGPGAVLVAQIIAGGVGLNIQEASVVVLCEPQLKPTTEDQAIMRAHRIGQLHTVQVHRLLSENSVDQRIVDMLAKKRQIFTEYARVSDMAATPEALDVSDSETVRQIIAEERQRLAESPR